MVKPYNMPISLNTKRGVFNGSYITNPGLMPMSVKRAVFDDFYPVAVYAFEQNKNEEFEKDVWEHLFNVDGLMLAWNELASYGKGTQERGSAFYTYTEIDTPYGLVLYIKAMAVDFSMQGNGISRAFVDANVAYQNYAYATARTQNPIVVNVMANVFGDVAPITRKPRLVEQEVGRIIAKPLKMGRKFSHTTLVGKGVYPGQLNGTLPEPKTDGAKKVLRNLRRLIDPTKGDCVICVSPLT